MASHPIVARRTSHVAHPSLPFFLFFATGGALAEAQSEGREERPGRTRDLHRHEVILIFLHSIYRQSRSEFLFCPAVVCLAAPRPDGSLSRTYPVLSTLYTCPSLVLALSSYARTCAPIQCSRACMYSVGGFFPMTWCWVSVASCPRLSVGVSSPSEVVRVAQLSAMVFLPWALSRGMVFIPAPSTPPSLFFLQPKIALSCLDPSLPLCFYPLRVQIVLCRLARCCGSPVSRVRVVFALFCLSPPSAGGNGDGAHTCTSSFAVQLEDRPEHECLSRFISKFVEAGMEKVDRVMDLYMEYSDRSDEPAEARCIQHVWSDLIPLP